MSAGAFERPRAVPWHRARGVAAVVEGWQSNGQFVFQRSIPPRPACEVVIPDELADGVRGALATRGIERLYTHQAEAFALARSGPSASADRADIVVATPTASGKSLCYNLPVLDALARDESARAIYLFPTKALSRDQEEALGSFMRDAGIANGAITYDGDTPGDARRAGRERSAVLLTNPDMLHAGILPHHPKWARLFANLRYVVVDELHSYRGVFGSHLANVLRRLQRIAAFHGSSPRFVFASATIGNPAEHASKMIGRPVTLIGESGAPEGPKRVLVYNPPVVNAELGIRRSYLKSAVSITCDLVRAGVPTLVFGQSRNGVEMMLKYLRDRLRRESIDPETIHAYRGGYLPDTRRRIEAGLRAGEITCVVATNALELGIDIGSLEAVVCAGYPGNVAALWQRFGRGGRKKGESVSVLVTSSAPLDQYIASDPGYLVGAPVEQARIDPDNVEILLQHLKCAAFELPFAEGDGFGDVPPAALADALDFLASHAVLHVGPSGDGRRAYHWASDAYPANHVSLRSASWDNFVVVELASDRARSASGHADRTIAEMDWRSTHTMLHEQAIYQHEGDQYQVERLDYDNHKAFVRKVAPDYYTTALTHTKVNVLDVDRHDVIGPALMKTAMGPETGEAEPDVMERLALEVGLGDVNVVEKVVGYKKIKFHTHENVGYGDVHLPEMQMHTSAFWLTFPEAIVRAQAVPRPVVIDCLRGFATAMHTVAAMGLMTDPRDLGRTLGDRSDPNAPPGRSGPGANAEAFDPTIFLYDYVAGGIGLAPRLFEEREALVRRSRALVEGCGCAHGCPACIGPTIGIGPDGKPLASLDVDRRRVLLSMLDALGVAPLH